MKERDIKDAYDNVEKNNKKKIIIVVVIMVSLLAIGIGSFIIWDKFFKEDEYKYSIYLYKYKEGYDIVGYCIEPKGHCDDENPLEIKTKKDNAKIMDIVNYPEVNGNYIIYRDDYLYYYDIDNNEKTKLNIDLDKYNTFEFIYSDNDGIIGIQCSKVFQEEVSYMAFYNLDTKSLLYEDDHTSDYDYSFSDAGDGYLNGRLCYEKYDGGDFVGNVCVVSLLDKDEERVVFEGEENGLYGDSYNVINDKKDLVYLKSYSHDCRLYISLYVGKKNIFKDVDHYSYVRGEDYIMVIDNNTIKKYDFDGQVIKKYNGYDKVLQLFYDDENYLNLAAVIKNGKLVVMDLDNEKEYVICDWNQSYNYRQFHSGLSHYRNFDEALAYGENKTEDLNLYLLIEKEYIDDWIEIASGIIYVFNPKTHEIDSYTATWDAHDYC